MTELKDQLSLLGRKTEYKQDYAPEVLEAFDNKHPGNDYWVRFNCPEFTSLCPITGQPDFAEIRISYIPDVKMVESKSLKLYLFMITVIILIFGEITPKTIAAQKAEKVALAVVKIISICVLVFRPVVAVLNVVTGGLIRLLGCNPNEKAPLITEAELKNHGQCQP